MSKRRTASPTLTVEITEQQWRTAQKAKSGGCLIADAIKKQYPHLTMPSVDMATVRVTDRKAGKRYVYFTPPSVQHLLLSFDQGWPQPVERVVVKGAKQIIPVTRSHGQTRSRAERLAELEAKEAAGEALSKSEKASLTRLRRSPERPAQRGPAEMHGRRNTVVGGQPIPRGVKHPNLLGGTDRHFGVKLADPGEVFEQAVEAEVALRMAQAETEKELDWR